MTAMAERVPDETPLVQQFIQLHGRRPTEAELRAYRRSGLLIQVAIRRRLRSRAARIITRL